VLTFGAAALLSASAIGLAAAATGDALSTKPTPAAAAPARATPAPPPSMQEGPAPQGFAAIVRRVAPSVVTVIAWAKGNPVAGGSGFIADTKDGLIVTNHHVIEGASAVEIRFANGTRAFATQAAADQPTDIALLKVPIPKTLPSVEFGDENRVQVGDWVIAIGSPVGLSGSVSVGILSARERRRDATEGGQPFTSYLQITTPINHGNSGGPAFDVHGRVIGINTLASYHVTSATDGSIERDENIGFAIPVSTVKFVIASLKNGQVNRGLFGAFVQPVTYDVAEAVGLPTPQGAFVSDVVPGSPAEQGGIQPGDVILKVNGQPIKDDYDCLQKVSTLPAGNDATFTIWRDGKTLTVKVKIAPRDTLAMLDVQTAVPSLNVPTLGLNLLASVETTASAQGRETTGMVIADVDSTAQSLGLNVGDRLIMIGGDQVRSLSDVNLAIEKARSAHRLSTLLYVETKGGAKTHVVVKLAPK
jgi:serine protease Do